MGGSNTLKLCLHCHNQTRRVGCRAGPTTVYSKNQFQPLLHLLFINIPTFRAQLTVTHMIFDAPKQNVHKKSKWKQICT